VLPSLIDARSQSSRSPLFFLVGYFLALCWNSAERETIGLCGKVNLDREAWWRPLLSVARGLNLSATATRRHVFFAGLWKLSSGGLGARQ
jgi:hypothetical protein